MSRNITAGEYVTVVDTNDVLFGRGSGPNDHEGNIKFRDLVSQRKGEYMATNHRQTKAKIAKAIVDTVFDSNGRFLKKLELNECQLLGFSNGVDVYVVVDDDVIMEKAKQALRQNREKLSIGSSDANNNTEGDAHDAMAQLGHINNNNDMPQALGHEMPPRVPSHDNIGGQQQHQHHQNHNQNQQHHQHNFGVPETVPVRTIYSVEQKPSFTDNEGYATYTTTLGDPDDEKLFSSSAGIASASTVDRRGSLGYAPGYGGSRRGSLLGGRKDSRRESLQLAEAFRRDSMLGLRQGSMQMSELMESFKGMSTTTDLNSSSDTIGTIDNMYGGNGMSGISNMSVISMSSTTSLFKTPSNENLRSSSTGGDLQLPADLAFQPRERVNSSDMNMMSFRTERTNSGDSEDWASAAQLSQIPPQQNNNVNEMRPPAMASLSGSDIWGSRQLNSMLLAPIDSSSNIGFDGSSRPTLQGNPDFLSSSAMSIQNNNAQQDNNTSSHAHAHAHAAQSSSVFDINKSSGRILPP